MAADVLQAPRIARNITNMEVAAAAARARRAPAGAHVDPDLIDNALADLEVARIFLDATENYHDELNAWLNPKGYAPNRALHAEVHKAQTMAREADDRLSLAEGRLSTALDQSYNAMPSRRPAFGDDIFFSAWMAYSAAFNAGNAFYLLNYPGDDKSDDEGFQAAFDAHVEAVRGAARILLATPATCAEHMERKQIVMDQQEAIHWNGNELADVVRALVSDAVAFAGGAA